MISYFSGAIPFKNINVLFPAKPKHYQHVGFGDVEMHLLGHIYEIEVLEKATDSLSQLLMHFSLFGEHLFDKLSGEFILIVHDKKRETIYIVMDHIGSIPFYYCVDDQSVVFSDFLPLIKKSVQKDWSMNPEWIDHFLVNKIVPGDQTYYTEISRLKAGHYLKIHKETVSTHQYYNIRNRKNAKTDLNSDYEGDFEALLLKSVQSRMGDHLPVGAELSGGLDSTGVTGILNHLLEHKEQLHTYSHSLKDITKVYPFLNEEEHIERAKKGMNIHQHFYSYVDGRGIMDEMRALTLLFEEPIQFRYMLFLDEQSELAQKNQVHTIFSGFGGDEMVTSHAQGIQQDYLKNWRIKDYLGYRKGRLNVKTILGDLAGTWLPETFFKYRQRKPNLFLERMRMFPLRDELKNGPKLSHLAQSIHFPYQPELMGREQDRMTRDHVSQRIQMTKLYGRQYEIEYRFPMWDKELIEFYHVLPPDLKYHDGIGRYIYRKVIEKYIPKENAWRDDKTGATIPNTMLRYMHDFEQIEKYLKKCAAEGIGKQFFDFEQMLEYHRKIKHKAETGEGEVLHGIMINYISLLMYLSFDKLRNH